MRDRWDRRQPRPFRHQEKIDPYNLLLGARLGARRPGGEIVFKPPAGEILEPGMTLIAMGDVEHCHKARKFL